jgi:methylated-DNA-[protein]-cysteine S-methyltransferase
MTTLSITDFGSPIGVLRAVVSERGLCDLDLESRWELKQRRLALRFGDGVRFVSRRNAAGIATKLQAYFAGDLDALDDIECDCGGTPFQRDVWCELRRIPVGTTISYGELARRVGRPKASRPVGAANGRNPIAIVVPCHRVIGSDGTLTGSATGVDRKRWLLTHVGALLA